MRKHVLAATLGGFLFVPFTHAADLNFSGFASINAGKVLSGSGVPQFGINDPIFLADYPVVSVYDEDISFSPESLVGFQVSADLMEGLSFTGQIVARGANDFDAQIEWAYLSYEINDQWTVQAGKKRLPLFYYSDFFDVGYAYVWMRPPADLYTWQIFNYNGVNVLYNTTIGDWSISTNVYAGSEDDDNNKLLGEFFNEPDRQVREIWKNITGLVVNASYDWLEIRATAMTYTNERFEDGQPRFWDRPENTQLQRDGEFYGLSFNADFGNVFALSEFNRLKLGGGEFNSYMVTLGYRVNAFTPYIGYSDFDTDTAPGEDGEKHNTTFAGLRWDFHSNAAFKVQWDKVDDESFALAVAGDSETLTVGVDLVF